MILEEHKIKETLKDKSVLQGKESSMDKTDSKKINKQEKHRNNIPRK